MQPAGGVRAASDTLSPARRALSASWRRLAKAGQTREASDKLGTDLREKMLVASGKDRAQLNEQAALLLERRAQVLPQLLQLRDMALRGVRIELPLTGRIIPLVADDWAGAIYRISYSKP